MRPLPISGVRFVAASNRDVEAGLLGYVSCVLGGAVHADGIVVRRTRDRRITLSWPSRRDRAGLAHLAFDALQTCDRFVLFNLVSNYPTRTFGSSPKSLALFKMVDLEDQTIHFKVHFTHRLLTCLYCRKFFGRTVVTLHFMCGWNPCTPGVLKKS